MANYEFNFEDGNEEYSGVEVVDPALETKPEQTVQVVELEETEGFIYIDLEEDENIVTDSESAFPAIGDANDELRHTLLTGRDLQDQHPITAITGLREELNIIESLKTEYSDKRQVADYYQWKDTNYYEENRVGYFVTVCEDANTIEICDGTNVFGVTIDNAGFIGGQDDIARDISYGLVAHNGIVHVRCETDVSTGDYIISNQYGMAKKNAENYGFKVIGIEWVNGVKFAIVALNLSVDQIDAIGENITNFDARLSGVELNVLSAINLANEAYNKSVDAYENASTAIDTSNNVSNDFNDISSDIDNNNQLIQEAIETAIQAQTIADNAVLAAETLGQEAIESANEALVEIINTKKDVSETIEKIQTDVENSKLDIESAFENLDELKEDLEPLDSWTSDDGKESGIVGFVARANEDSSTLATLAEWKGEASNSIAGVIQTADANKASLDILAGFEYGNDYSLYPYVNSPKDENEPLNPIINGITFSDNGEGVITATGTASGNADFIIAQDLVLSKGKYSMSGCPQNGSTTTYCIIVKQDKKDSPDEYFEDIGLSQDIDTEEYSKIDCKFEIEDGDKISIWIRIVSGTKVDNLQFEPCLKQYYTGLSGLRNQVSKNGSSIDLLTSFSSDNGEGVAGLIAKVSDHDATLNSIATWQTTTSNAISVIQTDVSANYAKKTEVEQFKIDTSTAISTSISEASKNYAKQNDFTSFQDDINTSIASIQRKADADGASIQLLVANMSKHNVGAFSPAYGFNSTQAKEVLEDGVVYVPTVNHTEDTYTSSVYSFTIRNYYVWKKSAGTWVEYSNKVAFFGTMPSVTTSQYLYWYTDSSAVTSGYEPYTLYKLETYTDTTLNRWVVVASLKGNSSNRAISQIRQNANSIETSVTTMDNKYAGTKEWVDDNQSAITNVVKWHGDNGESLVSFMQNAGDNFASASQVAQVVDKDGNINAASIVTAVNNSGSSVTIKADKIVMTGTTTFIKPGDLSKANSGTVIDGSNITTGIIESANYAKNSETNAVTSGTRINLATGGIYSKNFTISKEGNISIKGKITASSGSIAGFKIGESEGHKYGNALSKVVTSASDKNTQYEVGFKATSGETDAAFYIWKTENAWKTDSVMFCVKNNGELYATAGKIGGWNIKDGFLDSYVGSTKKGMYLSSGGQKADSWIKTYNSNGDTTFKITKEGVMHAAGAVISGAITASSGNFANGVTIGGSSITAGDLRKLYRAARLGYNDSDSLQILRIDATSGKVGNWNITSAHLYCSSDTSQVFLDSTYLKVYTSSTWYNATWKQVAVAGKNSDARLKHNILNVESKYEELFNCLQPKTFGYTEKAQSGDPNHIHFGFIAQDILATEKQLNLDNLSFVFDNEGYYGLKMDEFIALNTWQIQKAKARITELEEKVEKLEKLINDK